MVEVDRLTKYYGNHVAIEDVSFSVAEGEILGFLGPNAAGKTTTMRIVTGFMPPTGGTARVAGFDVVRQPLEARRRIGYLPEQVPMYDDMSVRDFLAFCARLRGVSGSAVAARVRTVMDATQIAERADSLILKLSKGFRQRVGIAQAMVHDPPILVLDEPTVGLDPRQIVEVREMIRGLRDSHTVILSTHILSEVQMLCDRIVIINEGRVTAVDTPENLTARLRGNQRVTLVVRGPAEAVTQALSATPGVASVHRHPLEEGVGRYDLEAAAETDIREPVAACVVAAGWGLREMGSVEMSLEDVYIRLTADDQAEPAEEEAA
ncbi:MAG: ABC transporter ATP-binding protein [Armatimonadetes bacterium]|nr:ABC transporter ATP-binding protein [Armatimonadota bacterium]